MQEETIVIGSHQFKFQKMRFNDLINTQQLLIRKMDMNFAKEMFSNKNLEDINLMDFVFFAVSIVKNFEGAELINFMTDLFVKTKCQYLNENSEYQLPSLEKCFGDNPAKAYKLIGAILKYSFTDFFLEMISMFTMQAPENSEKITLKNIQQYN